MSQRTRILFALLVLAVIALAVLATEVLRHRLGSTSPLAEVSLAPGNVPLYLDGRLVGGFSPDDLSKLTQISFIDAEEGKTQEGWSLRDIILLYIPANRLKQTSLVIVSSSSRNKSAELTWAEVDDSANRVMFDLAGRGTLKLVSLLERLDIRDEWIQDVDRIEVTSP